MLVAEVVVETLPVLAVGACGGGMMLKFECPIAQALSRILFIAPDVADKDCY